MFKIIHHTVTLPAGPERLFDMYMDLKLHEAIAGGPVTISVAAGSEFRAFDGMIFGKTLAVVPKSIIVQSWRGKDWKPGDRDSLLILNFLPEGDAGKIELVHLYVPERHFDDVSDGWQKYY
jgi:activator of HSP90 ATPase